MANNNPLNRLFLPPCPKNNGTSLLHQPAGEVSIDLVEISSTITNAEYINFTSYILRTNLSHRRQNLKELHTKSQAFRDYLSGKAIRVVDNCNTSVVIQRPLRDVLSFFKRAMSAKFRNVSYAMLTESPALQALLKGAVVKTKLYSSSAEFIEDSDRLDWYELINIFKKAISSQTSKVIHFLVQHIQITGYLKGESVVVPSATGTVNKRIDLLTQCDIFKRALAARIPNITHDMLCNAQFVDYLQGKGLQKLSDQERLEWFRQAIKSSHHRAVRVLWGGGEWLSKFKQDEKVSVLTSVLAGLPKCFCTDYLQSINDQELLIVAKQQWLMAKKTKKYQQGVDLLTARISALNANSANISAGSSDSVAIIQSDKPSTPKAMPLEALTTMSNRFFPISLNPPPLPQPKSGGHINSDSSATISNQDNSAHTGLLNSDLGSNSKKRSMPPSMDEPAKKKAKNHHVESDESRPMAAPLFTSGDLDALLNFDAIVDRHLDSDKNEEDNSMTYRG